MPDSLMDARIKSCLDASKRLFSQLAAQSKAASASSSSTLFGMLGGLVGGGIAYGISTYTGLPLIIVSPVLAGVGIVIGVLAYRGRDRLRFESKLELHKQAVAAIREEISLLPENAPQSVKDEAWNTYSRLLSVSPATGDSIAIPQQQSNVGLLPTQSTQGGR